MNKEKEALLEKIKNRKDTPHVVSSKSIERWLESMKPQDDDMRAYLIAYFSVPTFKEKQALKQAKLASLSVSEQNAFNQKWWQCIENDMNFKQIQGTSLTSVV